MEALASDVLAEIIPYLSSEDVINLLGCGSCVLTPKIVVSWKKAVFWVKNFSLFPFSAFNLPYIADLNVQIGISHTNCVLRLNHALPLPKKPVMTLQKICFRFTQCFDILGPTTASLSLSSLFPRLTELRLEEGTQPITPEFLYALPRTLQKLSIVPSVNCLRSNLRASDLQHLPRELVYLHLSHVNIEEKESDWQFLPQTLKSLNIFQLVNSKVFHYLPPTIETVSITIWYQSEDRKPKFKVSNLPSTLRSLYCPMAIFILDSAMPPFLERFNAKLGVPEDQDKSLVPIFPKSMTELPDFFISTSVLNNQLAETFPNLASLTLSAPVCELLSQNPNSNFFLQNLPQSLTSLNVARLAASHASKIPLPATLRELRCRLEAPARLQNLPDSLESLCLPPGHPAQVPEFQTSDWMHLPSGITRLECHSWMLGPPETLGALRRYSSLINFAITTTEEWISRLIDLNVAWPESITELRIECPDMQNSLWLASLTSMRLLKSLSLYTRFVKGAEPATLGWVPKSLKELSFLWIPENGFYGLPEGLESLSAYPSYSLDPINLQGLPQSLTKMSLRGKLMQHHEDALLLLPKQIANFSLHSTAPAPNVTELHRSYYSNPIWEGALRNCV